MRVIQDQGAILAHWVYTREEWMAFRRWDGLRRSLLHYLLARLPYSHKVSLPEIIITGQRVVTNEEAQPFMDQYHKLKRVNIRDTGAMNILEITYEKISGRLSRVKEIRIPVPKGRLKEAVEVHDCLMSNTF